MIKVYLPAFGDLHFEKNESPETLYTAVIDDYRLESASTCVKISSDSLNEQCIEVLNKISQQLGKMNDAAKQAYLGDFNDEEESIYIDSIYKKFLDEAEFTKLKQRAGIEQRLLFAVNLTSIDIDLRKDIPIIFNYIKGYELSLTYKFNKDYKLKEMTLKPEVFIIKEQLFGFIDKWNLPEVNEICSRFRSDWQNYPARSYFIYLMATRIKDFLSRDIR